eukprot:6849775-Pyramimonas_sp.AAC.1
MGPTACIEPFLHTPGCAELLAQPRSPRKGPMDGDELAHPSCTPLAAPNSRCNRGVIGGAALSQPHGG